MDENQLGRRNLTNDQRSILRGRVLNRTKKAQGGNRGNQHTPKGQSVPLPDTSETLAAKHGVSEKTIRRDGKKADAFEKLLKSNPEAAAAVMRGTKRRLGNCCLLRRVDAGRKPTSRLSILACRQLPPIGRLQRTKRRSKSMRKRLRTFRRSSR